MQNVQPASRPLPRSFNDFLVRDKVRRATPASQLGPNVLPVLPDGRRLWKFAALCLVLWFSGLWKVETACFMKAELNFAETKLFSLIILIDLNLSFWEEVVKPITGRFSSVLLCIL